MSFDEHDGSENEIKTLYHKKSKKEMTKMMNLLQDMNEHLVLALVEVDKKSTYDKIVDLGSSGKPQVAKTHIEQVTLTVSSPTPLTSLPHL